MNAKQLVEATFLAPFSKKDRRFIGVELEFPLLNCHGTSVEPAVIRALTAHLLANGFTVLETDIHGNGVFFANAEEDCLSFDNSYNNFEFSMAKNENLTAVSHRFYALYDLVQAFLLTQGHTLTGMGTNPHQPAAETLPVDYPIYRTIRQFLSGFSGNGFHQFTDFPAWLSSVQTHLDVALAQLPRALTLFAALDFVRALLFSNSLPFANVQGFDKTVCFRDYLWENSGFGSLSDNTGPVCGTFKTPDDITDMFFKKSMFLSVENGTYHIIPTVPLAQLAEQSGQPESLAGYLSFKNVEITRRGTLEIRSDCAQPVSAALAPPAFNLGLLHGLAEAEQLLAAFWEHLPPELAESPARNQKLRQQIIYGAGLPVAQKELSALLTGLVALAEKKLKARGFGEEKLLKPLFKRAESLTCPAQVMRSRLAKGETLAQIVGDFANPNYPI